MYFFTGDEHFGHKNIILPEYCNRMVTGPFATIEENDAEIIRRHNEKVKQGDLVIHCGDLTLKHRFDEACAYIHQLNGEHIFLRGSHDRWMEKQGFQERWEKKIGDVYVVADHYPGRVWARSHYGSIQAYGHVHSGLSHTKLKPLKNQYDVGVDNNNFYPVSLDELKDIIRKNNEVLTNMQL
jgi:calcineurin-like phosphoesterase family protein